MSTCFHGRFTERHCEDCQHEADLYRALPQGLEVLEAEHRKPSPYRWVHPTADTTWLDPETTGELERRLRYGPILIQGQMVAATALDNFRALVRLPRRDRERVIAAMRKARRNRG